ATELSLNQELFRLISAIDTKKMDPVTRRFVEHEIRDFRRSGVDKDEKTRKQITQLRDQITAIGQDFSRNIREDVRFVEVDSESDLAGLPADFIAKHPPGA